MKHALAFFTIVGIIAVLTIAWYLKWIILAFIGVILVYLGNVAFRAFKRMTKGNI